MHSNMTLPDTRYRLRSAARWLVVAVMATAGALPAVRAADATTTHRIVVGYASDDSTLRTTAASDARRSRLSALVAAARPDGSLRLQSAEARRGGAWLLRLDREVSLAEARRIAASMRGAEKSIRYAEPDLRVRRLDYDDPYFSTQWNIGAGGVPAAGAADFVSAWAHVAPPAVKPVVAVIDTGYLPHADMGADYLKGPSFITDPTVAGNGVARGGDGTDPGDYCDDTSDPSSWHGLKVASLIAAQGGNGAGIVGAASGYARVLSVRALGRCGGWLSDASDAIAWSAGASVPGIAPNATPAKVLNLSLGGDAGVACPVYMQEAVNTARSLGALVVAAAGNDGLPTIGSPANCDGVLAVGAHTRSGDLADYSNYSSRVTLTAPGGGDCLRQGGSCQSDLTVSLGNSGLREPGVDLDHARFNGTSAATPHVAAAAALLWAAKPTLTASQVESMLLSSAKPFVSDSFCAIASGCGAGMLDPAQAVLLVDQPILTVVAPSGAQRGQSVVRFSATLDRVMAGTVWTWTQVSGATVSATQLDAPDGGSSELSFTLPAVRSGPIRFNVTAVLPDSSQVTGTGVTYVNNAPTLDSPGRLTTRLEAVSHQLGGAADVDADTLTFVLDSAPEGVKLSSSGLLTWGSAQVGTFDVVYHVTDGELDSPSRSLEIVVTARGGTGGSGGGGAFGFASLLLLALASWALRRTRA